MFNQENQFDVIDFISVLSFIIAIQNLLENREQSEQNDVQSANDKQANYLLNELKTMFEAQNKMLDNIIQRLDKLEGDITK